MAQSDQTETPSYHCHVTDVWQVWIDSILGCENPLLITQVGRVKSPTGC